MEDKLESFIEQVEIWQTDNWSPKMEVIKILL